ncbi:MAG: DUF58 domain-containing protein [Clostridia bacterium]|nr:DUF58 domain-containing protein [Clostridia bacterium]
MSRKSIAIYLCSIALLLCLYFFENNTGTRIVLLSSLSFLLIPSIRKALFGKNGTNAAVYPEQLVRTFSYRETDEPGDIRVYMPGDPINRIHWKLSAKRDEILIRPQAVANSIQEELKIGEKTATNKGRRHAGKLCIQICLTVILLSLLLLFLIPYARQAMQALCNRIYESSEAVNAYVYEYFAISPDHPVWPAVLLLAVILTSFIVLIVVTGSCLMSFSLFACSSAYQIYFGISFPAWLNIMLFLLFALSLASHPWKRRGIIAMLAAVVLVSVVITLFWSGTDAGTEMLSEKARDRLSQITGTVPGAVPESPEGENETRHVHTESLVLGDAPSVAVKEYRLVTKEEEQISMPNRIDYLKTALLFLLVIVLLILPFMPFLWLNARRKKAIEARNLFCSEDRNAAVCAIFQHAVAWLEATRHGAGNLPYREWTQRLSACLPMEYTQRFAACVTIFEEAAYSDHLLTEQQWRQMLEFIDETEKLMKEKADFRQKLSLKYRECLWI